MLFWVPRVNINCRTQYFQGRISDCSRLIVKRFAYGSAFLNLYYLSSLWRILGREQLFVTSRLFFFCFGGSFFFTIDYIKSTGQCYDYVDEAPSSTSYTYSNLMLPIWSGPWVVRMVDIQFIDVIISITIILNSKVFLCLF